MCGRLPNSTLAACGASMDALKPRWIKELESV
jgi:hypothetical protein